MRCFDDDEQLLALALELIAKLKKTRYQKTRIEMQNVLQILDGEIKESLSLYDSNGDVKANR